MPDAHKITKATTAETLAAAVESANKVDAQAVKVDDGGRVSAVGTQPARKVEDQATDGEAAAK